MIVDVVVEERHSTHGFDRRSEKDDDGVLLSAGDDDRRRHGFYARRDCFGIMQPIVGELVAHQS